VHLFNRDRLYVESQNANFLCSHKQNLETMLKNVRLHDGHQYRFFIIWLHVNQILISYSAQIDCMSNANTFHRLARVKFHPIKAINCATILEYHHLARDIFQSHIQHRQTACRETKRGYEQMGRDLFPTHFQNGWVSCRKTLHELLE